MVEWICLFFFFCYAYAITCKAEKIIGRFFCHPSFPFAFPVHQVPSQRDPLCRKEYVPHGVQSLLYKYSPFGLGSHERVTCPAVYPFLLKVGCSEKGGSCSQNRMISHLRYTCICIPEYQYPCSGHGHSCR